MRKADNFSTILGHCHVIWEPSIPGTLWALRACNGTDLPFIFTNISKGQDIAVGIATGYNLDGPGIQLWWGEIFCARSDRAWGPPILLYSSYRVSFLGGKAIRAWIWPPTPSRAEVKQNVEMYLYSPCGPSWPVLHFIWNFRRISEFLVGKDWCRYSTDMMLINAAKLSKSWNDVWDHLDEQLRFFNNPLAQHVSGIIMPIFRSTRPYITA